MRVTRVKAGIALFLLMGVATAVWLAAHRAPGAGPSAHGAPAQAGVSLPTDGAPARSIVSLPPDDAPGPQYLRVRPTVSAPPAPTGGVSVATGSPTPTIIRVPPPPPSAPPAGADTKTSAYLLEIPSIGVKAAVVEGVDDADLDHGAGHYPNTPQPGPTGNAAIAGHRTKRLKPSYFYALDKLQPGDYIYVNYPHQQLVYVVDRVFLTTPYDLTVLNATPEPALTLTTCDPPGDDQRRLIVRARLTETKLTAVNS